MPLTEKDLDHILEKVSLLWHRLAGKRIFVTGGTGFLGKWLLESFAWANERLRLDSLMVVLSRNPDSFKKNYPHLGEQAGIQFLKGDVGSFDFPEGQFDFVIHAATDASAWFNEADSLYWTETIVNWTKRVL